MGILSVDMSNPELLKPKEFDAIPQGLYTLEVSNALKVEDSKSTPGNKIVKIELRVLDDGEYKGRIVFDNLVIAADADAKKNTEWKIAQFAVACGWPKDKLDEIDLDYFKGQVCAAHVKVVTELYKGEERSKNVVKQYVFDTEEAA